MRRNLTDEKWPVSKTFIAVKSACIHLQFSMVADQEFSSAVEAIKLLQNELGKVVNKVSSMDESINIMSRRIDNKVQELGSYLDDELRAAQVKADSIYEELQNLKCKTTTHETPKYKFNKSYAINDRDRWGESGGCDFKTFKRLAQRYLSSGPKEIEL